MQPFEQFLEAKQDKESNKINAIEAMVDALKEVFKRYTLPSRRFAFDRLTSKKGIAELEKLVKNPRRSSNLTRNLWAESQDFDSWLAEKLA